ncbi:glutamate ABC transporter substrate-binding protein [Allorhizocola rhizosphaerae]|uniref:glutamate ABC transporter substrate-binding protein n=1 Tax=Allorhizocola rhizosphaerae TaxID=1872709 RepID=UPI000E3D9A56|nr:glutamate ABC transporter substrate-binding protein [Allorhizocola rhizosphaerae]
MRVKRIIAIAAAAVVAFGVSACAGQQGSGSNNAGSQFPEGSTMRKIAQAGKITIGIKWDQPRFGLKGLDGKFTGFDVEIGKLLAKELGLDPEKAIKWEESVTKAREDHIIHGRVDMVIATYTINAARKEKVAFAGPYYIAGQDILVAKGDTSITGPDSFKEGTKKVCSVTGSTPAKTIEQYVKDKAQIVLFDVYTKCLDALKKKQVDAVTTDNVILMGYVTQSPNDYQLVAKPFTKEPYGIGVKKDDTVFRNWINDKIEAFFSSGSYKTAWNANGSIGEMAPIPTELKVDRY